MGTGIAARLRRSIIEASGDGTRREASSERHEAQASVRDAQGAFVIRCHSLFAAPFVNSFVHSLSHSLTATRQEASGAKSAARRCAKNIAQALLPVRC